MTNFHPFRKRRAFRLESLEHRCLLATVELSPVADNTLFEDDNGQLSNGSGQYLFAGQTSGNLSRRGLIRFDVASAIPAGATIEDATLSLHMSKTISGAHSVALHTLLADWGEAGSNAPGQEGGGAQAQAGDATWTHARAFDAAWSAPGGDFVSAPVATTSVNGVASYDWTGAGVATDVQKWLEDPANNFGWLLRGNESRPESAKRFDSRENPNAAFRPTLTIEFSLGNQPPSSIDLDSTFVPDATPGAAIGQITVTDPDAGDTHTLEVSDARFEIVGGKLKLRSDQQLNHQAEPSVSIEVTATDSATPPQQLSQQFTITVLPIDKPFANPVNNLDVNADGLIAPLDVLLIINFINSRPGTTSIPSPPASPPPFVNTNGDDVIAPLDALLVINFLNSETGSEGERRDVRIVQEITSTAPSPPWGEGRVRGPRLAGPLARGDEPVLD